MKELNDNFFENFFMLSSSCGEDNDFTVQILENDENDKKLYFKPVHIDLVNEHVSGIFLYDKKDAEHINELWNMMGKPGFNIYDDPRNGDFDSILIDIQPRGDTWAVGIGATKVFQEDSDLKDQYLDTIIDFLNQENIRFNSLNYIDATDLKLDETLEQELLGNAVDFFNYFKKEIRLPGANLVSPVSGEQVDFLVMAPPIMDHQNFVVFCIFPDEDSLVTFAEHAEAAVNPQGQDILGNEDMLLLEIHPKNGKQVIKDQVFGRLKNWNEEEKRALINKFLTVVKDVCEDLEE